MEILAIVLSGLLSLVSGGGTVLNSVAASRIFSQVDAQKRVIRIDNTPSYQISQGKVGAIRIAAQDVEIKSALKIAVLELETDPVDVDLTNLRKSNLNSLDELRESLDQPFQGAGKLILTEADLNQALQSPEILAQLEKTLNRLISSKSGSTNIAYELQNIQVELSPTNHLGVKFKLSRSLKGFEFDNDSKKGSKDAAASRELAIALKLKIKVLNSKIIQITETKGSVNGRPISPRLLNGFAEGISDRLNLDDLAADGILARILQLEVNEDKLKLVGFLKLETKESPSSSKETKVIR